MNEPEKSPTCLANSIFYFWIIFFSLFLNEHYWPDWWYYTDQYVKQGGDEQALVAVS